MSATRDPSQKHTFVYSNLYQLYQKGKAAAKAADVPAGIVTGKIIKADELAPGVVGLRVARHEPPSLIGKRINPGVALSTSPSRSMKVDPSRRQAIDGLRDNLRSPQNLHERLRFMLKEIEELSNE